VFLLIAVWLLVVGYGLLYVGVNQLKGTPVNFLDTFTGKGQTA
jgi:hypothetical protein